MSFDDTPYFLCDVYEARPASCRNYPWRDAQVVFRECVFVNEDVVESLEETKARVGGADAVERACQQCGRCCFGWIRKGGGLLPVIRCSHLRIFPSSDPCQAAMLAVQEQEEFS